MQNKKIIFSLLIIILIVTAGVLAFKFKLLHSTQTATNQPTQPTNPASGTDQNHGDIIKEIAASSLTGTISRIEVTSITLHTDQGDKTYNLVKNTLVTWLNLADKTAETKSVSDFKIGDKIYLQFDPKTNNVLTISPL